MNSLMSNKLTIIASIIIIIPIMLLAGFVLSTPAQQPEPVGQNTAKPLSQVSGNSQFPQITASGKNVYVVWQYDNPYQVNPDITFIKNSFDRLENLSNSTGSSEFPQIAASGNNVFVVWKDNSTGNDDIYLRSSTNNGTRFSRYNKSEQQ